MEICDFVDGFLNDARAVDEVANGDQHPLEEHRVIRREAKIVLGQIRTERAGRHTHRPHIKRPWVAAAVDMAVSEPHHGRRAAEGGDDPVASRSRSTTTSPRSVRMRVPAAKQATVTSVPPATGVR